LELPGVTGVWMMDSFFLQSGHSKAHEHPRVELMLVCRVMGAATVSNAASVLG
jgi:hypothetical protein